MGNRVCLTAILEVHRQKLVDVSTIKGNVSLAYPLGEKGVSCVYITSIYIMYIYHSRWGKLMILTSYILYGYNWHIHILGFSNV